MKYAFQLKPHQNARYFEVQTDLAQKELRCMLTALGRNDCTIQIERLGGTTFLTFETDELPKEAFDFLCSHSSVYLCAQLVEGGLLQPLEKKERSFLPPEMPDILKYKGKTNTMFTDLMINLAVCASDSKKTEMTLLDPLCGRGTTLFCALRRGFDVIGVEAARQELHEGLVFADSFFKHERISFKKEQRGMTLPLAGNAPCVHYTIEKKHTMEVICTDTRNTGALLKKRPADIIVSDLPYGVQHGPQGDKRSLEALVSDGMHAWYDAMKVGGAMALAFNTYTLSRSFMEKTALNAGFLFPKEDCFHSFSHWVEQAVNRDIIILKKQNGLTVRGGVSLE